MAESLACGTPVIALRQGAAPEIVDDGRTGFLCADLDEMVEAVFKVDTLDRRDCRAAAEERFSVRRMAADHEALYQRLLTPRRPARPSPSAVSAPAAGSAQWAAAAPGRLATSPVVTTLNPSRKRGTRSAPARGR